MSVSTENFIKTLYKLEQRVSKDVKPGSIAKALRITNAAATDMSRKLAAKKLINYKKYKQLSLTAKGRKMALNIIRKHRLWESFLDKVFNLSLHEIHREAEMLEHQTSDFLAEKIDSFLNNPVYDPHGDPIPTLNGEVKTDSKQILLSEARGGNNYEIVRLFSSDKDFFDFCNSNNIKIGSIIWVEKQYNSQNMTEIKINQNKLLLSKEFTDIIYVKFLKQE